MTTKWLTWMVAAGALWGFAACDGTEGPAGPAGPAAWDRDGDGVCDPDEDVNGDGACDADDLRGAPGLSCWDSNGNGACDSGEDVDGDGECTAADCGGGGGGGVACWDLDGSGDCDLATEDADGNGACDVFDCRGVAAGTLSGTVTSAATGAPVAAAAIALDPPVAGLEPTTDAAGEYAAALPIGVYSVSFQAEGFATLTASASVVANGTTTLDAALVPEPVSVSAGPDVHAAPGDTLTLSAVVSASDGSAIESVTWTQASGAPATLSGASSASLGVTLASLDEYREELLSHIRQLERWGVQAVNPHALELAQAAQFTVTVVTSSGTYRDTVVVHADLPWAVSTGLRNVPIQVPVLLHGASQASYSWSLSGPSGAAAALDDTTVQDPSFTPDLAGTYTLSESASGASFTVHAGNWQGAISGIGADGLPEATGCTMCHNGTGAPDQFTAWRQSGHAHIFSTQLNTSTHYGEGCFGCHTVGFDLGASNRGFDDASDYADFLASGLVNSPSPDNWATVVSSFEDTAQLANIQCENCHGPNSSSGLHLNGITADAARVSYSSDVCAVCHGEPLRHARFQQWERSSHGNFTLAVGRGTSASCAPCHTAQGFVAALRANPDVFPAPVTAPTAAEAEPQTCVACHEPHMPGTYSSEPNDATVRVSGNTPLLGPGFRAIGVGRGALCITCHNSRYPDGSGGRAPHGGTQGDVMMGMNLWFVESGDRSPHSYLPDTCATCHMERTAPPADLSYSLGGTNHTFRASFAMCGDCHGDFDGAGLEASFDAQLEALGHHIAEEAADILNGRASYWMSQVVDPATDLSSAAGLTIDSETNSIHHLEVISGHGRLEFHVVLTSPVSITWSDGTTTSTNEIGVQIRYLFDAAGGTRLFADSSNMMRAGWNYLMISNDGSHGAHNPGLISRAITATMAQDLSR